tara:strand:+ start:65 stop:373 length:309 start_codon:yes stop_codon:yes gene_type:complete
MTPKEFDNIMSYIIYGIIFCIWVGFTFLTFVNVENYQDKPFEALVMAICGPIVIVAFGGLFCAISWCRIDTRMNAIDKIGTDESWDFLETMEMVTMFNDMFD